MTKELPSGWEMARLGDLGTEVRGQISPESGTTYDLYSVPAFPTGQPEQVDGESIRSGKRPVEEHDVLLCKINPRINRVWLVGPSHGLPQIASTEYLVLRPHEPRMAACLRFYLSSPRFRDWIRLAVEGATGSHTRAKSGPILEQLVPVPPLAEQQRIALAVEEHFSRLDAAEGALVSAQSRLAVLTAAHIRAAMEGWPAVRLGEMSEVFVGSTPSRRSAALWGGTVPWVSSGEIQFCRIRQTRESVSTEAVRPERVHPPGTVLLAMIGEGRTRGQAAILEVAAAHNQNSAAIRTVPSKLDPDWLFWVLSAQYEANRRIGSGNNQPALNKARVQGLQIPVPPIDEQHNLAMHLDEVATSLGQVADLMSLRVFVGFGLLGSVASG